MRSIPTVVIMASLLFSIVALVISLSPKGHDSAPPVATEKLEERISRLEGEVAALRSLSSSESTSVQGGSSVPVDQESLQRLLATLESLMAPIVANSTNPAGEIAASAEEIERTRQALAEVRREEMDSRISRWIDKERDKSEQLLAAVEEKMNLPWNELQRVREIMTTESESHGQILQEMWSATPPENRAEEEAIAADWDRATVRMKEIRRVRDEQLKSYLGEERFDELLAVIRGGTRPSSDTQDR